MLLKQFTDRSRGGTYRTRVRGRSAEDPPLLDSADAAEGPPASDPVDTAEDPPAPNPADEHNGAAAPKPSSAAEDSAPDLASKHGDAAEKPAGPQRRRYAHLRSQLLSSKCPWYVQRLCCHEVFFLF